MPPRSSAAPWRSPTRAGSEAFGADVDGFIGLAPLPNRPLPTWPEFYASRRVMPYVRAAVDRGALQPHEATTIEQAMRRIHDLAGPAEPPARIHGDLWSGNIVWGADTDIWMIDAAAHGGHRETDLAMLSLFGIPHLQRVLDAYDEAAPLADGWNDRVGAAPAASPARARRDVRRQLRRTSRRGRPCPARGLRRVVSSDPTASSAVVPEIEDLRTGGPMTGGERDVLDHWVDLYRDTVLIKIAGLDAEQLCRGRCRRRR